MFFFNLIFACLIIFLRNIINWTGSLYFHEFRLIFIYGLVFCFYVISIVHTFWTIWSIRIFSLIYCKCCKIIRIWRWCDIRKFNLIKAFNRLCNSSPMKINIFLYRKVKGVQVPSWKFFPIQMTTIFTILNLSL